MIVRLLNSLSEFGSHSGRSRVLRWALIYCSAVPLPAFAQLPPPGKERLVFAGGSVQKGRIAVDDAGRPHIVSDQGRSGRRAFYSYFNGAAWLTQELGPSGQPVQAINEPKIAFTRGFLYITYWWRAATPKGPGPWKVSLQQIGDSSKVPRVTGWLDVADGASPEINLDDEGRVVLSWRASGTSFRYQIFDGMRPLGPPKELMLIEETFPGEEDVGCSSGNDSDLDSRGVLHIACNNQEYGWFYSNSEFPEKGQGVQIIAAPHQSGCCHEWTVSSLAADRREIGVLYFVIGGGDNRAYLVRRRDSRWSKPQPLSSLATQQSEKRASPAITALPEGGAVIAWMENDGRRSIVHIARMDADAKLGPRKQVAYGMNPRFAVDQQRMVHVAYTRAGNLFYIRTKLPGNEIE